MWFKKNIELVKNFIALSFKLLLNYCLVVFLVIMIPLDNVRKIAHILKEAT